MEEIKKRKSPKRLTLEVSEEMHAQIKSLAAFKGIPLKRFVVSALLEALSKKKNV